MKFNICVCINITTNFVDANFSLLSAEFVFGVNLYCVNFPNLFLFKFVVRSLCSC